MTGDGAHWTGRAACARRLDLPWTTDAADVTPWQAETMRAVCSGCPVLFDCLAAVEDLAVTGGWWAGHDRDPSADAPHHAGHPWAVHDPADDEPPSSPLAWIPIRSRSGDVLGEQLTLHIA